MEEVIFSGGDPFLVGDAVLTHTMQRLAAVNHVKRIRFHTRVPVTFPIRITPSLLDGLAEAGKAVLIVVHFNHPKELTCDAVAACQAIRQRGYWLLNQSVLLKGVNDSAPILKELCERLFMAGVMPYYLHHPDRAEGTAHFDLALEAGLRIFKTLRAGLPGYLVPKYVIDTVDGESKVPVEEYLAP